MRQHRRPTARPPRSLALPGAALAGFGLLTALAPTAAAGSPDQHPASVSATVAGAPTDRQLSDARQAAGADDTLKTLRHFFARDGVPPNQPSELSAGQEARAAAAAKPRLRGATVPVYSLNPAFVSASAADRTPVATLDFTATTAVSSTGRTASVWTARDAGRWRVINIATGSEEANYAARADRDTRVFREPQLHAWYAVREGRVLPLNADARDAVGAHGTSVANYQRLVHQRYADKMPGSDYAKDGYAGGFDGSTGRVDENGAAGKGTADQRAAAETRATTGSASAGPSAWAPVPIAIGTGAAAVLGAAGTLLLRRHRRNALG